MALIQCYITAQAQSAQAQIEYIYAGWPPLLLDALTGAATTSQDDPYPLLDVVTVLEVVSAFAYGGGRGPENRVARMGEQRTDLLRGYTNVLIRMANLLTEGFIDRDGIRTGLNAADTTFMRGPLDIGGNKVSGLASATDAQDLITFFDYKQTLFDYEDRRDFADQATLRRDSSIAMAGNLDMGVTLPGQRVTNLGVPTQPTHMVYESYYSSFLNAFISARLPRTGVSPMTNSGAPWDMDGYGINELADPTADGDGVPKGWFDARTGSGATQSVPIGMVMPHMGGSAPTGFLVCDGREVSRSTYSALFAVIGIAYGTPSGGTTFVLPDLRGRVIIGLDNMGGVVAGNVVASWGSTLGGSGGLHSHLISTAELPSHTHDLTDSTLASGSGGALTGQTSPASDALTYATSANLTAGTGGGLAHNNVQPSMAVAYIIRAG